MCTANRFSPSSVVIVICPLNDPCYFYSHHHHNQHQQHTPIWVGERVRRVFPIAALDPGTPSATQPTARMLHLSSNAPKNTEAALGLRLKQRYLRTCPQVRPILHRSKESSRLMGADDQAGSQVGIPLFLPCSVVRLLQYAQVYLEHGTWWCDGHDGACTLLS